MPSQTHRPTFINKQIEVKNNVALVHSYHARKAFCLSISVISTKSSKSHFHNIITFTVEGLYNVYIEAEVGVVISVYLHIPIFKYVRNIEEQV